MNAMALNEIQIRGSPASAVVAPDLAVVRPPLFGAAEGQNQPNLAPEPSLQEVEHAAEGVNAFLKSSGSHVQFTIHEQTKRMMVEVVDDRTEEVIKTIPAKEVLDLAAKIGEMVGLLLDKKG